MGFTALDLQQDWMCVTDAFLCSIVERCTDLQKLSLSWTGCTYGGGRNRVSAAGVASFVQSAGSQLTCLRLACCKFLTDSCIAAVVRAAPLLDDIDLQCCSNLTP